jgi:hypothetical protein
MTKAAIDQALENIYTSLNNDNEDIDLRIAELKQALGAEKSVTVNTARLAQNNREGRKMMQSYFKKRGVIVEFSAKQ